MPILGPYDIDFDHLLTVRTVNIFRFFLQSHKSVVKMAHSESASVKIDLDQFKLHLSTRKIRELTLHFDTPSRKFYLSVIALVVEQMRKNRSNATVSLADHMEALALLNETVGGGAGSSKEKKLLSRIYRKWKSALPDLENAPLFKVIGRSKEYGDASGKTYRFDDSAKDAWANLFEYKGSREKVRLRLSVEKLGIKLEDVVIVYGRRSDLGEERAWNRFIESLRLDIRNGDKPGGSVLNLGNVIPKADKFYENGVNIDARIEPLSDGESICISGTASDQIKNRPALRHNYFGERSAKNISKAVQVYNVPMDPKGVGASNAFKSHKKNLVTAAALLILAGIAITIWSFYQRSETVPAEIIPRKIPAAASSEMAAFLPFPDKPSIAVLPFVNISGDSEENYLSDGITEQIITALSKTPKIFVIARNSVFTYKGKPVTVQQVSKKFGVRYVLEGSVQKSGDRLRITAQLIDATTGNHLWAEKYDRELKDIFELEDNIARNVIMALQVKLTEGETARVFGKGTANLEAYLKVQQGLYHVFKWNKADDEIARELYREAIELGADTLISQKK